MGKELAERLMMTQASASFYGTYKIKIDWFGSQVLSFLSAIRVYEPWLKPAQSPVFYELASPC